jgi:hypothetical protein
MNFDQFKALMRYNNWKRDPYSNGDPGEQICSRYDLRTGISKHLPARLFGGLDAKCLKLSEAIWRMHFHAIGGPVYDESQGPEYSIPHFKWPEPGAPNFEAHDGLPEEYKFDWITFESWQPDNCSSHRKDKKGCLEVSGCGFCTYSQTCLPGEKQGPYFNETCEAGWEVKTTLPKWALSLIVTVSVIVVVFVICIFALHFWRKRRNQLFYTAT